MKEEIHMTVARCMPEQVDQMRDWFWELETKLSDPYLDGQELLEWMQQTFSASIGMHWQRLLFGYETLIDNACDPSKSHLAWKPEIANKLGVEP